MDREERRRLAEQQAAKERDDRLGRIADRLNREAKHESESQRELEDFTRSELGATIGEIQDAFSKDMPDAQVMRDFKKIKRSRRGSAKRKRLVKGGPGRRVKRAYKKRKGCRLFALALLVAIGGMATLAGWGVYEGVAWAVTR